MKQFLNILSRQWLENRRLYFISTLVFAGTLTLLYAYNILSSRFFQSEVYDPVEFARFSGLSFRPLVFTLTALVFLCFYSAQYFSVFGRKSTAIQELMLPVTPFERTLSGFLLSVVLMMLTSIFVITLVDTLFIVGLKRAFSEELAMLQKTPFIFYTEHTGFLPYWKTIEPDRIIQTIAAGMLFSTIFTLGSIYFSRMSFLKTSLYLVLIFGIQSTLRTVLLKTFWKGQVLVATGPFETTQQVLLWIGLSMIFVFWVAIYHRLKEKEV